ncbi:MAG: hypothetical protein H6733_05085 [Alphaproteobacteria bacterium]|nr:hypothetical protein [Alphaproteobacteria bacterium]
MTPRWLALAVGLTACGPVEPDVVDVIDPAAWVPVDRDDDPLASHRPPVDWCPTSTWGEEDGALEVQTGACPYLYVVQADVADLQPGDRLVGAVWHADLDAASPAQGHVALLVGDRVVWERTVDIPGAAAAYDVDVVLPDDLPTGAPLGVHLHNHGYNAWKVGMLSRER